MKTWTKLALGVVLTGALVAGGAQPGHAQALDAQMQRVVARFVEETGMRVMAVGSWVGGTRFNPATSDFDMRLVVSGGTEAQQMARWQQAQQRMGQLIRAEFGDRAGDILSRTNLYAPNQLMTGIETTADAMDRFQRLGRVPNLGYQGPVNASTPARFAEGLYGEGAQVYIQGYEKASGRLFYNNGGRCVTGLAEVAHLGEGTARYTIAGTANTAGQWAEHCLVELQAGRSREVVKYLERLERDLVKARSLSRLPMDTAFRTEMQNLRHLLQRSPGQLAEVTAEVARVVGRGQAEAALVGAMENAGPIRRAYLRVMVDGVAAKNQLGKLVDRFVKALPPGVNLQNAFNGLMIAAATSATAEAAGRGDTLEALGTACSHLKWIVATGPLLVAELTTEILREAEASGYVMAAGSQKAWDLMAGIYTAWGRAGVDPDRRRSLSRADLLANFQYENRLEAVVYAQCLRAASRDLGSATARADQGVADAIFAQCWPVIRDSWRWDRDLLTSEYLQLASEIVHTPILVYYQPNNPKPGETVTLTARSFDGRLGERLQRMREIIRILYGKGSVVADTYYWEPRTDTLDWRCSHRWDKPGTYPMKVKLDIQPITNHTQTEFRVMLRRELVGQVEVIVGGEAENEKDPGICPNCGNPLGTGTNCFNCMLHAHVAEEDLQRVNTDEVPQRREQIPGAPAEGRDGGAGKGATVRITDPDAEDIAPVQ